MLAVLIAALTSPVMPKPVPVVAPQRYRIEIKSHQEVDLTALQQGLQASDLTAAVFVSLTMSDTAGGRLAHMVIDSMTIDATGQLANAYTQSIADESKGSSLHAYIVGGKVKDSPKMSVENTATAMVGQTLSLLFPGIRQGVGAGSGWVDTTESNSDNNGVKRNSTVVTNWKVSSGADGALTYEGTGAGKIAGEGQGQQITGTSNIKSSINSTPGGPTRSGSMESTQNLQVVVPSLPDPVPVTSTSTLKLVPIS